MFRLLLVVVAVVAVFCGLGESAQARGRARKCWPVQTLCVQPPVSTARTAGVSESSASSRSIEITRTECDGVTCRQVTRSVTRSTAQTRAEKLAQLDPRSGLHPGHHAQLGPVSGYEGLGYGSSPDDATRRCCFWGQRSPREIGTAPGPSGGWYAVVLYD